MSRTTIKIDDEACAEVMRRYGLTTEARTGELCAPSPRREATKRGGGAGSSRVGVGGSRPR